MAIPLSYNFRNLRVRKTTTVMTALGIALTVAVLLGILAMVTGLKSALQSSGNPLQMIVVRKNSASELVSQVAREAVSAIRFKEGIQKFPDEDHLGVLSDDGAAGLLVIGHIGATFHLVDHGQLLGESEFHRIFEGDDARLPCIEPASK